MKNTKLVEKLRKTLETRLRAVGELREAASLCRELASSDDEGAAVFLLLAFHFEELIRNREGTPTAAEEYESSMSALLPIITSCLDALDSANSPDILVRLDSLARNIATTQRV